MDNGFYLGLDQGSRSSKAVLLSANGSVVAQWSVPVTVLRRSGNEVEQDPDALLLSLNQLIDQAVSFASKQGRVIEAIGLACQRSGVCAWDAATGKVLHPLITWEDTRTKGFIDSLGDKKSFITEQTSLPVTPHYAGGKIALLQKKFPSTQVVIGTLDSFLSHRLTDESVLSTEDSMASRTMLYDLKRGSWSTELCNIFEVDARRLLPITQSLAHIGHIRGIPFRARLGDQQAALLAQLSQETPAVLNLGTISSLSVFTGDNIVQHDGYVTTVCYSAPDQRNYFIEAVTSASGNLLDHILRDRKFAENLTQVDELCMQAEKSLKGAFACAYYPMGGTGTPFWLYDLPLTIRDWDGSDKQQFVRAVVESLGSALVGHMSDLQHKGVIKSSLQSMYVSGGIAVLDYLLSFIADVSQLKLRRLKSFEASAKGAARGAFMSHTGQNVFAPIPADDLDNEFKPHAGSRYKRYEAWKKLEGEVCGAALR